MINKIKKNHKTIIIIPARLESKRLDKKLLRDIQGKPMIQRVVEKAKEYGFSKVIVATDSKEIFKLCKKNNFEVMMSLQKHKSGTDRVYEAYSRQNLFFDIVINLQGDLPLFEKDLIDSLIGLFDDKNVDIGTAVCDLKPEEINDKNVVKARVKLNGKIGYAIDFKRTIKSVKDNFHHIGIYAFRPKKLEQFVDLPQSENEINRNLEQLRAVDNNFKIKVIKVKNNPPSVDTFDDLEKFD